MAAKWTANQARFLFHLEKMPLRLVEFTITEELSSLYQMELVLGSEDQVRFEDIVGKPASLTVLGPKSHRAFHGIVCQMIRVGSTGKFYLYRVRLVPSLWLLGLERDCRIFQGLTTEKILGTLLKDAGLAADQYAFRLQGEYKPREYCVQYRESDLQFGARLLEEDGIFYFFEHQKDKHLLVFGDNVHAYQPIIGDPEVLLQSGAGMSTVEEIVFRFMASRQIHPGKVTFKDYNFERPALDLSVSEQWKVHDNLEQYDYPGNYVDTGVGKKLAQIRLQEALMPREWAEGESLCPRFAPGLTFKLKSAARVEGANQEYLLVRVTHRGTQPQVLEEMDGPGNELSYQNSFSAVPSATVFRPTRRTPKPVMQGVQTAMVVGPAGEEIHTDNHGRIKIQFHWDRLGKQNDQSSCWVRVSQAWAGAGFGAMMLPRIGQEVVVSFLEGDPDLPLITGRVYHGTNPTPYPLPGEKTKSVIKTNSSLGGGGSNELRFEDKKGREEVYIHAQKDMNTLVDNNQSTQVGANQSLKVGKDQTISVTGQVTIDIGKDQTESIGKNLTQSVTDNQSLSVGGNRSLDVSKNSQESVGGDKSVDVSGNAQESVAKDASITVSGKYTLQVDKDLAIESAKNGQLTISKKAALSAEEIVIEGKKSITLKQGSAKIVLKDGKVTIEASKITLKSSGDLILKGSKIVQN